MPSHEIHEGDALAILRTLPSDHYHGSLTDPPYGISFMGHAWDHGVPSAEVWAEVLRCLRPGAHLLAFGGTRTFHRLACAIEDAGFEIRDCMQWMYATGFPKSLDVSKPIALARYLARLILPPIHGARMLTPFSGSGSEVIGALQAGWSHVDGIDSWDVAVRISRARIAHWSEKLSGPVQLDLTGE